MQLLDALDNPAWQDSDKRPGWPGSERNPLVAHTPPQDALRFRSTKRAHCAPKETIMLYELRHRFARWRAYRQTLVSLRRVSDRTLADAGISREDIRERARHASLGR
jgi:uncharacterized protein YjiS (DUF1127 family)